MAASRRRDPWRWFQVRVSMWCALGAHRIGADVWMRTRKDDYRELYSCETCLAKVGVARPAPPPPRPVRMREGTPDVRRRQCGEED